MRAFIGLSISDNARQALMEHVLLLCGGDKHHEISWVAKENYHLTLAFLGDIQEREMQGLATVMAAKLKNSPHCELIISGLSYFPLRHKPKLIAALVAETEPLMRLYECTQSAVREVGLPVEKRNFNPHVTLGRIKAGVPRLPFDPHAIELTSPVTQVVLFESELHPKGARYTPRWDVPLLGVA